MSNPRTVANSPLRPEGAHDEVLVDAFDVGRIKGLRERVEADRPERDTVGQQIDDRTRRVLRRLFVQLEIFGHLVREDLDAAGAEQERRVDIAAVKVGEAVSDLVVDVDVARLEEHVAVARADAANSEREGNRRIAPDRMAFHAGLGVEPVDA